MFVIIMRRMYTESVSQECFSVIENRERRRLCQNVGNVYKQNCQLWLLDEVAQH